MKSFNMLFTSEICPDRDQGTDNENFEAVDIDPLQDVETDAIQPTCYRIENIVFAEPLKNISKEGNPSKDKKQQDNGEEMMFIDNIVVQKREGMKYKKYHINIEDNTQLTCPQTDCSRIFSSRKLLKAHVRKVHCADRSRYVCECCGRGFSARYLLERHAAVHSGAKVECTECGAVLSGRTSLSTHLRTHSDVRPHSCVVCSKTFTRLSTLSTHLKFVHRRGVLPCDHCDMSFPSRKQWSQHVLTHRRNNTDTSVIT